MALAERLGGLAVLVFALLVFLGARAMPYAEEGVPGPGFAPTWVSLLLAVAGVWILARSRVAGPMRPFIAGRAARVRTLLLVVAIVLAVWLVPRLGMVPSLALFIAAAIPVLGARRWQRIAAAAVIVPATFYLVFQLWLKVPFPRGPLGF